MSDELQNDTSTICVPIGIPDLWSLDHRAGLYEHPVYTFVKSYFWFFSFSLFSSLLQRGPNKVPINALLVISAVTLVFIAIGEMNRLATLATMPFLITYGVIEYAYFVLCMQFDLNQQRLNEFRAHGNPSPTFDNGKAAVGMNGTNVSLRHYLVVLDDFNCSYWAFQ
jgi:hypothetical protein